MKFILQHLLVVYAIYCAIKVFNNNLCTRYRISFYECNSESLTSVEERMSKTQKKHSTYIRNIALSNRIIAQNHEGGYTSQHTVRIALLNDYQNAHCAGTLQNALYVITAAHCVNLVNASEIIVTAGTKTSDMKQNRSVTFIEMHEGWNSNTQMHDIALLKLNASLVLSVGQVSPVKLGLPQLPNASMSFAWITGWGLHDGDTYGNLTYPKQYVQIKVSLVDLQTCKELYKKIGKIVYENQICAEREAGYGPCTGDDGAPLTVKFLSGIYSENVVFGILSSYQGCATGAPHVYTDLEKYKSWIESKAGRQCDFNIHAYDFDNPLDKDNHNSNILKKTRGIIDGRVAQTVCAKFNNFLHTDLIQEPLKFPATLHNFSYYVNQPIDNNVCTNWLWNTCLTVVGCSKFRAVDCQSAKQELQQLYRLYQNTKMLGTHDATPNQHPYQIRIIKERDGKYFQFDCGGVIYNSMYVLTAAYCVHDRIPCSIIVIAGDHSVSITEKSEQVRRVVAIMSHEKYVHNGIRHNDIAILKIDSPFNLTTNVQPILLATKDYPTSSNQLAELSGWGQGKPDILQTVVIPFIDDCDCRLKYSYKNGNAITPNKICTGRFGHGLCDDDKGSPLTVTDNQTKYLVGIASFSALCGNSPGVATKVYAYREWIALRAG